MQDLVTRARNTTHRLLRLSEKYLKTDTVYLAKGGFWIILSQIILSVSSFLVAIAFAHFVSKEAYGEYKYILSLSGILGTFTLSGLAPAITESVARGYEGTMNYAFWKNIRWSVLFFLAALSTAIYYFVQGNTSIGFSILVAGSFSPFLSSTNFYGPYLNAKKDFKRAAIYFDVIGGLFPALALFITMLLTNKPFWFVVAYFVSNTLIGVILYTRVLKIYQPNKNVDKEALNYGKHLSLMNVLGGVANNIDQVLVFHYIGAAELAIYNFAIAIPNQTNGPLKGLGNMMFPKFVERTDKEIVAGMSRKFLLLFITGVVMATAYILTAPFIFKVFFPKYMASVIYSQIFSISLLSMTFSPLVSYLSAKKKIKELYIGNISLSIIQIVITAISIIFWGLMGLVIGRVIIKFIGNLIVLVLYNNSTAQSHA